MEDLIRSKLAELEVNFPEQLIEQKLAEEFQKIENAMSFDESFICRQFDSAVIDERNPLEERITAVRNLFLGQVRSAKNSEVEYYDALATYKSKCQRNNLLKDDLARKTREKQTVDELRIKLQDMNKLLQRQIKEVAEESKRMHEMEKQRMEELSITFSTTIAEISQKIAQQEEEQMKQAGDNQQLREKLAEFSSHSRLRDQHFQSQIQAKDLELQLVEARIAQEAELFKQEKSRSEAYRSDISHLSSNKANLKEQIKLYADKFDQFKDALTRSEAMFAQFEDRIFAMSNMVEVLEMERNQLKAECNKLDVDLLTEFEKKRTAQKQMERSKKEKDAMAAKCRVMQTERTELLQKLQMLQQQQADIPPEEVPPANT